MSVAGVEINCDSLFVTLSGVFEQSMALRLSGLGP